MKQALKKLATSNTGWAINRQLCKWICRTNIGLQFHVFGHNDIKKAQKFYPGNSNYRLTETVADLKANGCARKKESYPQDLINTIRKKFSTLVEDEKNYVFQMSGPYKGPRNLRRALKAPVQQIPELTLLIDDSVRETMESYYGAYFRMFRVVAWRNYHVPDEYANHEAFSNYWHFDQCTTALMNLFVNISDVTESDGPFLIQPRPRTNQIIKMGYKDRSSYGLSSEVIEDPNYIIKHVGPAGSGMYASTPMCLHRASIPEEGHYRDIVSLQFMPSEKQLPKDWGNGYVDRDPYV
jgi:hypothetical protein